MWGILRKNLRVCRYAVFALGVLFVVFTATGTEDAVPFALFLTSILPMNLFELDSSSRFEQLIPVLPISGVACVMDKYLASWLCMALIGAANAIVRRVCAMAGPNLFPAVAGLFLLVLAVLLPLVFRLGVPRARVAYVAVLLVQVALLSGRKRLWTGLMEGVVASGTPILLLGIAANAVSVFVAGWAFDRHAME